ncbi:hypothetical protein [Actinomadura formosensis]|uniref:hypothetical protein n=1 Tax=Actinomadura formosensis TaxID=60706 RepID=UPI003D902740
MPDRTPGLRERLAEALNEWTLNAAGASRTSPPVHPRTLENLYANSLARADAVLPVVEAETAALRQRAEKAERQRDEADRRHLGLVQGLQIELRAAVKALGEAERERDAAKADAEHLDELLITERAITRQHQLRGDHAVAAVGRVREAIRDLTWEHAMVPVRHIRAALARPEGT